MRNAYELYGLIGKNMKHIRKNIIKKSQEKMADDGEISRGFLSRIESPNIDTGISLDTLFYLAQKYKFDIRLFFSGYEELMKETNTPNNNNENEELATISQ